MLPTLGLNMASQCRSCVKQESINAKDCQRMPKNVNDIWMHLVLAPLAAVSADHRKRIATLRKSKGRGSTQVTGTW